MESIARAFIGFDPALGHDFSATPKYFTTNEQVGRTSILGQILHSNYYVNEIQVNVRHSRFNTDTLIRIRDK